MYKLSVGITKDNFIEYLDFLDGPLLSLRASFFFFSDSKTSDDIYAQATICNFVACQVCLWKMTLHVQGGTHLFQSNE